jgi:ribulose-5-phosphate 4-epimerase/fuculose-1-phosphate aldolase
MTRQDSNIAAIEAASIRQLRVDLAASHRLAVHFGLHEAIDNHLTAMLPCRTDGFLVAPYGLHWSEVRASDLLVVSFDGAVIDGQGIVEDTAFYIHAAIHRAYPRAQCVMHTHMPFASAMSMLERPILSMALQTAIGFHERIAYDLAYSGLAMDSEEGARLAGLLADDKVALIMGNHGALVIGSSVAEAFERLYYLERACQAQILAMSTGIPLRQVPPDTVTRTARQFARAKVMGGMNRADAHFSALKRMLDRTDPSYAN